jgi:hypothetical protein
MDQRIRRCELCKRQAERLHIAFEPEQEYRGKIYGPGIYIACFDCLHAIDKITTLDPAIPHVRLIV